MVGREKRGSQDRMDSCSAQSGMVLVSTLFLLTALLTLLAAYCTMSASEIATTRSIKNSSDGFFAAEAGLNVRAKEIRDLFVGYNRPTGVSPTLLSPCEGSNNGSGDFGCEDFYFARRSAITYVREDAANPYQTTIPPDELFQGLSAQEYRYTVTSEAKNPSGRTEAILELVFKSRLVPMFQFVAFFNKDLEILPGANMNLSGPIHTNGDLYLNSDATLKVLGQVSTASDIYRGRKNNNTRAGTIQVATNRLSPPTYTNMHSGGGSRLSVTDATLTGFNGYVRKGVRVLTVPEPEEFDAAPGAAYWDAADLRIVLNLNGPNTINTSNSPTGIEVRDASNAVVVGATNYLNSCAGGAPGTKAVGFEADFDKQFNNKREGSKIEMLDIDMLALLNCIQNSNVVGGVSRLMGGRPLNDATQGGLVFHFSVKGPLSAGQNNYGVRVNNADKLQSSIVGAPLVKGLTIVSDQAFYSLGHYNRVQKIPASFLVDSYNVLSTNWNYSVDLNSALWTAADTTVNAAVLAGTDVTGGIEGEGGQNKTPYSGGFENYPRFHERWTGKWFTYRGSFVTLGKARKVDGVWVIHSPYYEPPQRNWDYDTDFNTAEKLPPMAPRFVYLRQELFVRDFEQN
jgi:hypothetical protein